MEMSQYMESVTAARSLLLTEAEALAGETTLSLETQEEFNRDSCYTFLLENFGDFLRLLRFLRIEDQEILLSYYCLGIPQRILGDIHSTTQTVMSFKLRLAIKALCAHIVAGGVPTEEWIHNILEKAGLEATIEDKPPLLSTLIVEFAICRSFGKLAYKYDLHRPNIRRAMSRASAQLLESKEPDEQALGAYIFSLTDKANPVGTGVTKRQAAKRVRVIRKTDPAILGQFRVKVDDKDFGSLFIAKANR